MLPISSQNIMHLGVTLPPDGGWARIHALVYKHFPLTEGGPASTPWSINVALPDGGRASTQACFYFFKY